ncbi:MAG: hypothetical protein M4579_002749 [Chaenotheca gracillima]|nr:MAG: hypothetical protein M4579_002749 [Chaenotheca gracillima]
MGSPHTPSSILPRIDSANPNCASSAEIDLNGANLSDLLQLVNDRAQPKMESQSRSSKEKPIKRYPPPVDSTNSRTTSASSPIANGSSSTVQPTPKTHRQILDETRPTPSKMPTMHQLWQSEMKYQPYQWTNEMDRFIKEYSIIIEGRSTLKQAFDLAFPHMAHVGEHWLLARTLAME